MRASPATLLRGLAKLIAVVVVAAVVGVGLGYGLSEVRGTADSGAPAAFTTPDTGATDGGDGTSTGTTGGASASGSTTTSTSGTSGSGGANADEVAVDVVSATLKSATTASGRARKRASIGISVKVTNNTGEDVTLGSARIAAGGANQVADPAQASDAGALLRPIADGASATGTYRFETAGDLTTTLQGRGSATLRIGDVSTPVQLDDTTP